MSACAWPLTFSLLTLRENVSTDRASEGGLSVSEPTAMARQTRPPRFGGHGARAPLSTLPIHSMQPEHAVDGAQFGGLDQLGMRDRDGEQRAFALLLPQPEKVPQHPQIPEPI